MLFNQLTKDGSPRRAVFYDVGFLADVNDKLADKFRI